MGSTLASAQAPASRAPAAAKHAQAWKAVVDRVWKGRPAKPSVRTEPKDAPHWAEAFKHQQGMLW